VKNLNPRLVLVHLGTSTPSYLVSNVDLLLNRFPKTRITLVYDNEKVLSKLRNRDIDTFFYDRNKEILPPEIENATDPGFRNGYWRYTLERFFAISQFHRTMPNESIIHIESDILIMPNFPFKHFEYLSQIAWIRIDEFTSSGAILFLPSYESTDWFCSELTKVLSENGFVTDMIALRHVSDKVGNSIFELPTLRQLIENGPEKIRNFSSLQFGKDPNSLGIFDGAELGMWLAGIDPRLNYGTTKYFIKTNFLAKYENFDEGRFRFMTDEVGNLILTVDQMQIAVWDLHIHSKEKKLFDRQGTRLRNLIAKSHENENENFTHFDIKISLLLLLQNLRNRTLGRFLLGPILNLRMIVKFRSRN